MQIEESPFFRKTIIPWYDCEVMCLVFIVFLDAIFLFSAVGISVAREIPEYNRYIWLPTLLMAMSGGVIFSVTLRLMRRYLYWLKIRSE
jgi:hypothetical protein